MLAGIFAVIAIVGIVLFVNSTITGKVTDDYPSVYYPYNNIYAQDFYVGRPSGGVKMVVESGVVLLQTEPVVNDVCRNAVNCFGLSTFVCCMHDGRECIVPNKENRLAGSCPTTHRSRCLCREDYMANLFEKYG